MFPTVKIRHKSTANCHAQGQPRTQPDKQSPRQPMPKFRAPRSDNRGGSCRSLGCGRWHAQGGRTTPSPRLDNWYAKLPEMNAPPPMPHRQLLPNVPCPSGRRMISRRLASRVSRRSIWGRIGDSQRHPVRNSYGGPCNRNYEIPGGTTGPGFSSRHRPLRYRPSPAGNHPALQNPCGSPICPSAATLRWKASPPPWPPPSREWRSA